MRPEDRDELAMLELMREAAEGRAFSPPMDVYATERQVVITVELPGVVQSDISVEPDGDQLLVRGRRVFRRTCGDYYRLERKYGAFSCQVALPRDADADQRRIALADGVLTVEIPRVEHGRA